MDLIKNIYFFLNIKEKFFYVCYSNFGYLFIKNN